MDQKKLLGLVSVIIDEFEDDDDELTAIAAMQQCGVSKVVLSLRKDRERHFRLGHLSRDQDAWIQRYLDTDFHGLFRMRKDTFMELVNVVQPHYPAKLLRGDAPLVTCSQSVLITLYYMGNEISMNSVGDRFGVALSTFHKEVHRIVSILCDLKSRFIIWPKKNECPVIEQQFRERSGFTGVLGAIDGCHVEVLAPADDQVSYTDRKMNHSIILQGICTATKIFTNVSIETPGSRNDNRALAYSSFFQRLVAEGHRSMLYEDRYHLVGDKAYPNRSWLLAPFKNYGNLTRRQRNYNYKHSVTRVVIEHTFGLLKGRWRRLLCLTLKDVAKDSNFVLAACVLHNFCYLHSDDVIKEMVTNIRTVGAQAVGHNAINDELSKQIGDRKREEICDIL